MPSSLAVPSHPDRIVGMKNKGLLITAIVLFLFVLGEWIFILFYPQNQGGQQTPPPGNSTTPEPTEPEEPSTNTPPDTSVPPLPELGSAVKVFEITNRSNVPGAQTETYRETQQLISEETATGKIITIVATTDRSASDRNEAKIIVEADGSYYLESFSASDAQGTFACSGRLPGYLAPGKSSDTASLSCTVNGQALPVGGGFSGVATSGPEFTQTFQGVSYKMRELTIVSNNPAITHGIKYTAAPGLGLYRAEGSLGDLVFGQLVGQMAGEGTNQLISSDNDTLFCPKGGCKK